MWAQKVMILVGPLLAEAGKKEEARCTCQPTGLGAGWSSGPTKKRLFDY